MIELYKHINNLYSVDASYIKRDQKEFQIIGDGYKLKKQRANKKQMLLTFYAVNSWNMLLSDVVEAYSLNAFKPRLCRVWRQ